MNSQKYKTHKQQATNKQATMDTMSRVNILAKELDRLKITNIAKRCKDYRIANDMSVILESWLKCFTTLDTRRFMIKRDSFTSSMALYTEVMRVIVPFQLEGMWALLEQYLQHYKALQLH